MHYMNGTFTNPPPTFCFLNKDTRFLALVREFGLVPPEFLVINWEGREPRRPKIVVEHSNPFASELDDPYFEFGAESSHNMEESHTILSRSADRNSNETREQDASAGQEEAAVPEAATSSPSGGFSGRKRTDTMYQSGDLPIAALEPVLGSGLQHGEQYGDTPEEGSTEALETPAPDSSYQDLVEVSLDDTLPEDEAEPLASPDLGDLKIAADSTFFDDVEDRDGSDGQFLMPEDDEPLETVAEEPALEEEKAETPVDEPVVSTEEAVIAPVAEAEILPEAVVSNEEPKVEETKEEEVKTSSEDLEAHPEPEVEK